MKRTAQIAVWGLHILLGGFFAIQGVVKLAGSQRWISRFHDWGYPDNFYLFVGALEVMSGVLLLIPKLAWFGAVTLMAVMVGATITHLANGEPQIITTAFLLVLLTTVAYIRRSNFTKLSDKIRSQRSKTGNPSNSH